MIGVFTSDKSSSLLQGSINMEHKFTKEEIFKAVEEAFKDYDEFIEKRDFNTKLYEVFKNIKCINPKKKDTNFSFIFDEIWFEIMIEFLLTYKIDKDKKEIKFKTTSEKGKLVSALFEKYTENFITVKSNKTK